MPKMKSRSAVQKRFSATASGRLKRKRSNLRHILEKKSQKRKKRAEKTDYVSDADTARIKRAMVYL